MQLSDEESAYLSQFGAEAEARLQSTAARRTRKTDTPNVDDGVTSRLLQRRLFMLKNTLWNPKSDAFNPKISAFSILS